MKKILFFLVILLNAYSLPAYSGETGETYSARLSSADHFNSRGKRLKSAAAIIRQDRANYHRFNVVDGEDTGDSYFSSKSNRAALKRMLRRGYASKSTKRAIINGTPLIRVEIFKNRINVYIEEE